jgi:hypothetical protein
MQTPKRPQLWQEMKTMQRQETDQPAREFRVGTIWVAIYSKETVHSGAKLVEHNVRIQRRYKDERTGKWGSTSYFRPEDLPRLMLAASKAYEYVSLRDVDPNTRTRRVSSSAPGPKEPADGR